MRRILASNSQSRTVAAFWLRRAVMGFAFSGAILFVAAGRWDWVWGWSYLGVFLIGQLANAVVLMPRDPGLAAERSDMRRAGKAWDRVIVILFVYGILAIVLLCALDERYAWSPALPPVFHLAGLFGMAAGSALALWAVGSNPFFSAVARIQAERGHRVIDSGPYRHVRHPGYLGGLMVDLATPLVLGSLWGLIPAVAVMCVGVLRTALEDRMLRNELRGYVDYASRVRWRLFPGIW